MSYALVWFRRDLRLADNPALNAALAAGLKPIPVFIYDEPGSWSQGAVSNWWLHHSLTALKKSLKTLGSDLWVFQGDSSKLLARLAAELGINHIFWNRLYDPAIIQRDSTMKAHLREQGLTVASCNGYLLREPWQFGKKDGSPYRVFTPFWKALQPLAPFRELITSPNKLSRLPKAPGYNCRIQDLQLLPDIPWDAGFRDCWQPGEAGAWQRLTHFIDNALIDYPEDRDLPWLDHTSQLSPHLHFGEISPLQVWHSISRAVQLHTETGFVAASEAYLRQLAWREFGHHLLYHFPHTSNHPLDKRFNDFPWKKPGKKILQRWQQGQTGIPIVDAGMRQLWHTGWMHNRVRMIVASLLTKNLQVNWTVGARWFWDTLVDANLANNTLGWQWTAGCGADAAPYFRIFNPVRQSERFDPDGIYIRQWVPELKTLPTKWIHQPWLAPDNVLADAGITLDRNYPSPVVDLAASRQDALQAWDSIKSLSPSSP